MPELPEVETVVRRLRPYISGRELQKIEILDRKLADKRLLRVRGKVVGVRRVGKNILIDLLQQSLKIHLRMTGNLIWIGKKNARVGGAILHESPSESPRAQLYFREGVLSFVDVRRFGTLELVSGDDEPGVADPFVDTITVPQLQLLIGNSRQPMKVWLLRQDRLAGIGNIYASEILFRARIHPERPANSLNLQELKDLIRCSRRVLTEAVKRCGTTFSDFRAPEGSSGEFQRFLRVYDRAGENCRRCRQTVISRTVQAQRSTYFCPRCQC